MRGLFVLLLSLLHLLSWGQNEIQYQNKALQRELIKEGIPDFSEILEITVVDSIKKSYRLQGKFFEIQSDLFQYKYIYTGRVYSCRASGCSISPEIPEEGESEYFDYFILFNKNKAVQLINVFNYQATHGQEVTSKGWLKQFIGHNGSEPLQVDKNIDAISGATISVYAITADVGMKTTILDMILHE